MSVYKHKNGRWYYKFKIKGRQYHRAIPEATEKKEAEAAEISVKRELLRGNYDVLKDKSVTPVSRLIEEFEKHCKENREKSEPVDKFYREVFKKHFKGKYVEDITHSDILEFRSKDIGKIQNSTINRKMSCLSSMFSLAVRLGWIDKNPCSGVKKLEEKKKPGRIYSLEEEQKILKACDHKDVKLPYMKGIFLCGIYAGMRISEILDLKTSCLHLEDRLIHVLGSKTRSGHVVRDRWIPIADKLYEELKKLPLDKEYVFTNPKTGTRYYSIKRQFKKIKEKAGIDPIRFHDSRHTAGSRMAAAGVEINVVGELLGHTQLKTTQRYLTAIPERKKEAIKALNNFNTTQKQDIIKSSKCSRSKKKSK